MNRVNWKMILYIIIGIVIFGAIIGLIFSILPFLLIGFLIFWGISKIRGKRSRTVEEKETIFESNKKVGYEDTKIEEDDFDISKAVDVDFENVDDKK